MPIVYKLWEIDANEKVIRPQITQKSAKQEVDSVSRFFAHFTKPKIRPSSLFLRAPLGNARKRSDSAQTRRLGSKNSSIVRIFRRRP